MAYRQEKGGRLIFGLFYLATQHRCDEIGLSNRLNVGVNKAALDVSMEVRPAH